MRNGRCGSRRQGMRGAFEEARWSFGYGVDTATEGHRDGVDVETRVFGGGVILIG